MSSAADVRNAYRRVKPILVSSGHWTDEDIHELEQTIAEDLKDGPGCARPSICGLSNKQDRIDCWANWLREY